MIKKNNSLTQPETVADLRRKINQSFVSRNRVKVMTAISRSKRAARGYKIPIIASSIFVLLILSLAVVREFQRTSLLAIINDATNGTDDYSTLLSVDETDEFVRKDANEPERDDSGALVAPGDSTQSTSTSFTISDGSNSGSSGSSSSGSGSSSGSSGGGGSGGDNTTVEPDKPQPPFSASIDSFSRGSTKLECKNPSKPTPGNCSKLYQFISRVSTSIGPGSVSYLWQSSEGVSNGSITVGEGNTITAVTRVVSLPCNQTTAFTVQFNITSPGISNSMVLSVIHNCDEI